MGFFFLYSSAAVLSDVKLIPSQVTADNILSGRLRLAMEPDDTLRGGGANAAAAATGGAADAANTAAGVVGVAAGILPLDNPRNLPPLIVPQPPLPGVSGPSSAVTSPPQTPMSPSPPIAAFEQRKMELYRVARAKYLAKYGAADAAAAAATSASAASSDYGDSSVASEDGLRHRRARPATEETLV